MLAVEISSFGEPGVLRLGERPVPVAGAGELLIRVSASGINRPDVLQRKGHYAPPPGTSDLPGLEVAGVIEGGDESAMAQAGLHVGDRVCALVARGAVPARARRIQRRRGCLFARNLLHGVEQCVRAWPFAAGGGFAGARRKQRHRRDCHPAGPGAGRYRHRHSGQR